MESGFRTLRERVLTRFPIMRSSVFERRMLFERDQHVSRQATIARFERPSIVANS